jgi:uncharacterized protein YeaO (DUF488 family)
MCITYKCRFKLKNINLIKYIMFETLRKIYELLFGSIFNITEPRTQQEVAQLAVDRLYTHPNGSAVNEFPTPHEDWMRQLAVKEIYRPIREEDERKVAAIQAVYDAEVREREAAALVKEMARAEATARARADVLVVFD